jgi:hypothetical protein
MSVVSPAAILFDENGNPVAVTYEGGLYKLEAISKQRNVAGTIINPSTEDTLSTRASESTLSSIKDKTDNIPADPAREGGNLLTLASKDFSTETTLLTRATEATLASIKDTDGIKKITDALPAGTNVIGSISQSGTWSQVIYDDVGNPIATAEASTPTSNQGLMLSGYDRLTEKSYRLLVNSEGRLAVSIAPPNPPADKTLVQQTAISTISGAGGTYLNYTIPTGANLIIQRLSAGCAGEGDKGARVMLYWDPAGNGVGQTMISVLYIRSSSTFYDLNYVVPLVGNGTRRIRILRTALQGSTQEVYGEFIGYY